MLLRPGAAFVDRRVEHLLQPVARDDELLAEGFVAIDQRFGPGEAALELRGQLLEVRLRKDGRRRVVETARLLLERQTLAAEHPDPDEERRELTIEILTPQAVEPASAVGVVAPGLSDPGTAASDLRTSAARRPISASVQALSLGGRAPIGRSVVGVDVTCRAGRDRARAYVVLAIRVMTGATTGPTGPVLQSTSASGRAANLIDNMMTP